jgi:hypothetical protein
MYSKTGKNFNHGGFMAHKEGFKKVGSSEKIMYGPRVFIICGYTEEELERLSRLLRDLNMDDVQLAVAGEEVGEETLNSIMKNPRKDPSAPVADRAIIMAGITEKELKAFMDKWKKLGLPPQLWAVLTPTSENWTLNALLGELKNEAAAMKKKGRGR